MTDQLLNAIENLRTNVEENRLNSGLLMHIVPEVKVLDWNKPQTYLLSEIEPRNTVILAADVAWLLELVSPLVQAISSHLKISGEMYLAHQKRSEVVDSALFTALAGEGFEVSEVSYEQLHPTFRSPLVKVFKIIIKDKGNENML